MADANNGYNVNIAWDFLKGTADSRVFWLEEAFYEDAVMYRQLRARIKAEGLATLCRRRGARHDSIRRAGTCWSASRRPGRHRSRHSRRPRRCWTWCARASWTCSSGTWSRRA